MSNIEEEYSIALFEDGTKEMIPKAWIQDYLKEENSGKILTITLFDVYIITRSNFFL